MYSDDAYSWDDPIYGGEKTENDMEALRALDAAERLAPVRKVEDTFDVLDLGPARQISGGCERERPDAKFDRGEYWLRYFREADPEEENLDGDFGGEPEPPEPEWPGAPGIGARLKNLWNKRVGTREKKALGAESQETLSAPKGGKMRRRGIIAAASLAVLAIAGLVVVAEPWLPAADDSYTEPQPVSLGAPVEMRIGETYHVNVPLGDNEQVFSVVAPDSDILNVMDDNVTALGEWDGAKVIVTTMEKELPQQTQRPFGILGLDLTGPYNSLRSGLRNLLGIEKKAAARSELRVVGVYEQEFRVKGYNTMTAPTPINLYTNDKYELTVNAPDGRDILFKYEGGVVDVEKTLQNAEGMTTYTARSSAATGQGKIIAMIGFYKDGKFVTTGAVEFSVEVLEQPDSGGEAVFASGSYNGSVAIEKPQTGESEGGIGTPSDTTGQG